MIKKVLYAFMIMLFLIAGPLPLSAQESPVEEPPAEELAAEELVVEKPPAEELVVEKPPAEELAVEEPEEKKPVIVKVPPLFPEKNSNIIFIEGEDAVSTNFYKEPIKNYSCSGNKTLQLNRQTGLKGNAPFYADFLFLVEEPGTYELWYGGTPPGPEDEIAASYGSPFSYAMDSGEMTPVFRENMTVVGEYAPSYYWNNLGEVTLKEGQHKISFEVKDRRRNDNRYYFYLDNFFFVRKEDGRRLRGEPVPKVFPKDLDFSSPNTPFKAIDDLLIQIRDDPGNLENLVEISSMYSMLSDYLNAIKYLKRAAYMVPEDEKIQLLLAKNYLWQGDAGEGLKRYRDILTRTPDKLNIWLEAGKMAAWTSRYKDSIKFYSDALEVFPQNPELMTNLGITLIWNSQETDGEKLFSEVFELAKENPGNLKMVGEIFLANDALARAEELYKESTALHPEEVEFFILRERIFNRLGEKEKVEEIKELIEKSFFTSSELTNFLNIEYEKQDLKESVIRNYRSALEKNPDDLQLRELLSQTLFWNGQKREAIDEYRNILTNYAFRNIKAMDKNSGTLLETMDTLYLLLNYFKSRKGIFKDHKSRKSKIAKSIKDKTLLLESQLKKISATEKKIDQNNTLLENLRKAEEEGAQTGAQQKIEGVKKKIDTDNTNLQNYIKKKDELITTLDQEKINLIKLNTQVKLHKQNFQKALEALEKASSNMEDLKTGEEEEQRLFEKIIETNKWTWNDQYLKTELKENAEGGLSMASFLLGKMSQIEQKYDQSTRHYTGVISGQSGNAEESQYGLLQSSLWSGNMEAVSPLLTEEEESLSVYAEYIPRIKTLYRDITMLEDIDRLPQEEINLDVLNVDESILTSSEILDKIIIDSQDRIPLIEEQLDVYHDLLYKRMIRFFYQYYEETYLMRNELGDYYRNDGRLDEAIIQFRQVLAIDPRNISSIYQLGLVYQWNLDWKGAMESYKYVYQTDPYYENALGLYNNLARQYSDRLDFSSYYSATPSLVNWHGNLNYQGYINSNLGLTANYNMDSYRYYKGAGSGTGAFSYFLHDMNIGLPIDLYTSSISITPYAGVYLPLQDTFYKDELQGTWDFVTALEFLTYVTIDPYAYVDITLGKGNSLNLQSRAGYQRYPETISFYKPNTYEAWTDLNFRVDTSFTKLPVLKDSQFRTYTKWDFLFDGNILWAAGQYADIGLFASQAGDNRYLFKLGVLFQDSFMEGITNYYTPQTNLIIDTGFSADLKWKLGDEDSLALSGSLMGSYNITGLLDSPNTQQRISPSVDVTLKYTHKNGTFYMGGYSSASLLVSPATGGDPWDFWTLKYTLGYNTTMPSLLSP